MAGEKKEDVAAEGKAPSTPAKGKKDKDGGDGEEVQIHVDPRVGWFEEKVCSALKIKNDKWKKMISLGENIEILNHFLESGSNTLLFYLNLKDELLPAVDFPPFLKKKSIYFLKNSIGSALSTDLEKELTMGDIMANPLEFLSTLLEEVYLPLLTNPKNLESWPEVVANDVLRHFHQLNGAVYVISGKSKGKTMLPLPHGAKFSADADKSILHTLESAVIDWTHQIKDVIKSNSAAPLDEGLNPGPMVEIDFWAAKKSKILEASKSTYYPAFKMIFNEVVFALDEASDINTYLKTMRPCVERLTGASDFMELVQIFPGMMRSLVLIWKYSKFYNTPNRITVILREICNDIIEQARAFIQPSELFTSEPEEAAERIRIVLRVCEAFKQTYYENKAQLAENERPWNFDTKIVFARLDQFIARVQKILDLFDSIIEFNRLEKIEIGGTKGKILSSQVAQIFTEFTSALSGFSKLKYDVLNISQCDFEIDLGKFHTIITDLDRRIGTILCQAFDDCSGLHACFRLLESFSGLLNRPNIQHDFEKKYFALLKAYSLDLDEVNVIFLKFKDSPPIHYNMAPVTGALAWAHELKDRIGKAMEKLKTYNELFDTLENYEKSVFNKWSDTIIDESEANLNKPLLIRENGILEVNFDPKVVALLREVKYLEALQVKPPETAASIYSKAEVFRKYIFSLDHIAGMYNGIRNGVLEVERPLIEPKIVEIDQTMEQALTTLNWKSDSIEDYIVANSAIVGNLNSTLQVTKNNVNQILKIMKAWQTSPLIERKDGKKLLNLEEKDTKLNAAYEIIKRDGQNIHNLVNQTRVLLDVDETSAMWEDYLQYIDGLVKEGFWSTIKTSLEYLAENMDRDRMVGKEVGPLLEAKLELENEMLVFTPGMEEEALDGLMWIVSELLDDIYDIASLVPRISKRNQIDIESLKAKELAQAQNDDSVHSGEDLDTTSAEEQMRRLRQLEIENETYLGEMKRDDKLDSLKVEILDGIKVILDDCLAYKEGYEQFSYLWTENRQEYMKNFLTSGKDGKTEDGAGDEQYLQLEKFENEIRKFEGIHKTIMAIDPEIIFQSWFRVDARPLKQSLNVVVKKWSYTLTKHLSDDAVNTLNELNKFVKMNKKGLQGKIEEGDYNGLVGAMGLLHAIKHRMNSIDHMFEPVRKTINLLRQFGVEMPDEIHKLLNDLPEEWSEVKKLSISIKDHVAPLQAKEVDVLQQSATSLSLETIRSGKTSAKRHRSNLTMGLRKLTILLISAIKTWLQWKLKLRPSRTLEDIGMLKSVWDVVSLVTFMFEEWRTTLWTEIDTDSMENRCRDLAKELRRMDKEIKGWDVYSGLDQMVKDMITSLRALVNFVTTGVTFVLTKDMKFQDLLSLQLHKYEDDVKVIVDRATKELAMEKVLNDLSKTWAAMEFTYEIHESTKTALLRSSEELIETLEDNQVMLQNMMSSKYVAHFETQIMKWQNTLSTVDSVVTLWLEVQKTWSHLENIFMGSEDIRAQLPDDSKRFDGIDSNYKALTAEASKTPNCVEACMKEGIYETLEHLQSQLALCEKSLAEYLETKRLAFPRFYFVSATDLLDILAKETCLKPWRFTFPNSSTVLLASSLSWTIRESLQRQLLVWLNRLVDSMRKTLRSLLGEGVSSYEEKPREQWIFDHPAQITLAGTQIWWTTEVNAAFARLEEGYENAMKDLQEARDLSKNHRQMIMTVAKLIAEKAENAQCFSWQCQLRLRWDEDQSDCFINICDAVFRYNYEYLGNTPRLVITALTDRCYITLTQSLHLIMGGAPAGPAGTGKTETVKDLGKALAIMVYVFNCSEQMDYKSIGNIFKGLAQSGTWGCFDEFNRIRGGLVRRCYPSQIHSRCLKIQKVKIHFPRRGDWSLPHCWRLHYDEPGYAGRTELPENIKALFRPCSMVVPNLELICEIMLMAEGFIEASSLARKFNTLYKLNRELLSKQDHYDWGLRAIKSVLVVAGTLKRSDPNIPEENVFMGLIVDLFPKVEVPRKRNEKLEDEIRKATVENGLQAEDIFVLKVVQLDELMAVRHCVFIIGNGGTGKSQIWKMLSKTYINMGRKCVIADLNPKADGLFSNILRDQASMPGTDPKWMILDGDIDPNWIESLNTVMDDNKMLTLASNERIPLKPYMRLIFEIGDLKYATPATVSRAGILYLNTTDLGWNPYVQSWLDKREDQAEKSSLSVLFDRYVNPCLDAVRSGRFKMATVEEFSMVVSLCNILEGLLTPQNTPKGCDKEWFEIYFVFAAVWAFGGCMFQDQIVDYRIEFSKWWNSEFKTIKFPPSGTVFDYFIEPETKRFLPWADRVPQYEFDPEMPLSSDKLYSYGEDRLIVNVPFNFYTTAWSLQSVLEKPLEKKAGRNYGPPGTKKLIYFLDDLNMPEVDKYGTASPHTLLRQHLDYKHWYDRTKLTLKEIHNCQYVACMNPTAGSFTISGRLGRHFASFSVNFPGTESLQAIYLQILQGHLKSFPNTIAKLADKIVTATLSLHKKVSAVFLPSAVRFHYIFNLRDLSNIFQGILFTSKETIKEPMEFVRLWLHETTRTYADKMVEFSDAQQLQKYQGRLRRRLAGLKKLLDEAQLQYDEVNAAMNLVLFEDAMSHICRINRILESPRGNALLVGVGGSGKQSLSRLAAFISQMDVFQITLRKGYSINDLKTDLAGLYTKTGVKKQQIMFLLTDSQVADEKFLVLINDMLASGNIPGLFPDEEVDNIINSTRNEAKAQGLVDTREVCWDLFIRLVRKNLKVVLCFSPVGNTLRSRCRKFPAIVNCTMIDWFHEWPDEALTSVATRFISTCDLVPPHLKGAVTKFMSFAHQSVNGVSKKYLLNEKRYNYTTPKSFLALISLYKEMLERKSQELTRAMDRLENGLTKLQSTAAQVDDLKAKLAFQEVDLKAKNEEALRLIERVGIDTEKVNKEKAIAAEEEKKVDAFTKEVSEKAASCENDLKAAEPALAAAANALNTLNKANLTELKSFGSPSQEVQNTVAAVMVLLSPPGKIQKDRSWKASKNMMAKVDSFLESLITFNKEKIDNSNLEALAPYLSDPNFNEDYMKSKSIAAAGLCAWVVNIVGYYNVYCDVEPKRKALESANAELQISQARLRDIQGKIGELDKNLAELKAKFEKATEDKLKCEEEARSTQETIVLANRLVNGLASEKVRWSEAVGKFKEQEKTLAGDVLISAAFVSYVGCFSKRYREELLQDNWFKYLRSEDNPDKVPLSGDLDPLAILTSSAEIAKWNNEGLPTDRVSLENATMVTNCKRWPLIIDPQLQGVTWVKNREGAGLKIVRLGVKGYLDLIEKAVSAGDTVLIEDIAESIDPVLNPLLGRETIKKGRYIKMGDKEVEYDPKFKLILQTRRANPHYPPEIQAQTTLINFTVTIQGLEDQLLADVVNIERPDLERTKADLTKQQNEFKIKLTELEDALLSRLSAAQGNFLGDTALVENLEITKSTATDIEQKVEEAKKTEKKINETRELYRPVAGRSSLLYFLLNDLWQIHPMYQYSLNAYKVVFQNAIGRAEASEDIKERVLLLIDSITHMMTFQILNSQDDLDPVELDFLLRGPKIPNVSSPLEWLSSSSWGMVKALSNLEQFRTLASDIEGSSKQWKKYCENEVPENEKLPQEWKNKTPLQKLLRNFISVKMGTKYIDSSRVPLAKSYEEMKPATPIFFILSPGVDPVKEVEALGRGFGVTEDNKNFHNVSLGQGQEIIAEQKLDLAYKEEVGNVERRCQPEFRVFLSAEPAGDPAYHIIPISILQASIKITNEPPTGMQANIHRALDNFTQETLERCSKDAEFKTILFALCYFHAVILERRKFGTQGWNKPYPFSTGDLMISTDTFPKVPWTDLRYIFGEIMYGGHISDDWDRRLCCAYLDVYLREEMLEGNFELAPGFLAPPTSDYKEYHRYIDENLPPETPYLYMADKLFQTMLEMAPQDTAGGTSQSKDEKVKSVIEDILSSLPENFNVAELMAKVEERTPYISVAIQECDRMSMLTTEIRRSLKELELGLKGDLTITEHMETLMNSLFLNQVPASWEKLAYPLLPAWPCEFQLPSVVWLCGLFNPQSFLTAVMQTTARKNEWPLDRMVLTVDVTKKVKEEFSGAPREGAYIHGLFMEGARWDTNTGLIQEAHLKDLMPSMPVIYIRAIPVDKKETKGVYECPVYRTRQRGPTFIWTFNLKTKERPQKWILGGVALLCSID
ncbi:dynein heavy chain and region D6 of dynein motor-domain-containing protein [Chytridium lagenaria]|nr:dynein heavy chain and region D6 of dynein motor-domain-containing protein [Chytridium lagenaria]